MKILLTTRRCGTEQRNPIAILDLAGYLRSRGHEVCCHYLNQITANTIPQKPYDFVGLSVLQVMDEHTPVHDAIHLKNRFAAHTVVGGKWTQTLTNKQRDALQIHDINIHEGPGEFYFDNSEIDYAAYPSWDSIDFATLDDVQYEVMSTRGCPFNCHFCHNTERRVSFFSAQRTVDNIELLFKLGMTEIFFVDDVFSLNPTHMSNIYLELMKRGIHIKDRCTFFAHVNCLNDNTLEWINRYKPKGVQIGVESGDNRMLKLMGKGFTREVAYDRIALLHKNGHNVYALFLIGFPGETRESLESTYDFSQQTKPFVRDVWVSYYQPVKGTKGYNMAVERNADFGHAKRNIDIVYVDPNLSARTLTRYRYKIMDSYGKGRKMRRLIRNTIKRLPCVGNFT